MQKLFELKIFRTDTPYRLRFTDEFNKSVESAWRYYDKDLMGLIPGSVEFLHRCVYHHLYRQIKDEDDKLVWEITSIIITLQKAGLIDKTETVKMETI